MIRRLLEVIIVLITAGAVGCSTALHSDDGDAFRAHEDSLETVAQLLADDGADPETTADVLTELRTARTRPVTPRAARATQRTGRLRWRLTAVDGHRSDLRAVLDRPGVVSLGLRLRDDSRIGYLRFGGWGREHFLGEGLWRSR